MKKIYILAWLLGLVSLNSFAQVTITPSVFNVTDQITITVSFASTTCNTMGASPAKVYMHAGIGDDNNAFGFGQVIGNWGMDDGVGQMTNNGNGTYSKTITPSTYFNLNATEQVNATKMGMVFRNANGSQTRKDPATSCGDFIVNVGVFQATLNTPAVNSTTIINSGGSMNITANNTNGNASYVLKSNGVIIDTNPATASYAFNHTNILANQSYSLEITQGATTNVKAFAVLVNPTTVTAAVPAGMEDGINYNTTDTSKATLVLTAPGKDFVYIAGSFNNWQPNSDYAMKKDPNFATNGKFWLELTGLTPQQNYTYQYWVVDMTPFTNSPALVKTADPFSTLVVNSYDDPYIPASTYPNIPAYPAGQSRDVTVLQTAQTPYNWQVTNFVKPKKEDLIVYEVLVRDFDANRSYQNLIDKIDYFKNLHINAIELMPVMEFEGNETWGYNTSFHMALDKFYGPSYKLKEFIDLCHQNGIAVILDVALNHAFGRNPMVRMWMKDPDGDGWGDPSAENPYFNEFAKHSYGVGSDFNHSSAFTKTYVKRVEKQWIQEYKIDGFRWDLTKGFTQACSAGDDTCTNSSQPDRVLILKDYADYSWSLDPTHYAIFEHLGSAAEEQQWANYRINETPSKGVMMWGEMTYPYTQLMEGFATGADLSNLNLSNHGFTAKRLLSYPESHDKERLVYSAMTYGNAAGTSPPNNNLNNSLARMSSIGAINILVPGPKMIWHFADLGYDDSIFLCNNGTVNTDFDITTGDCKLDTKVQEQWTNSWLTVPARLQIYNDWARMIQLKINEPVFEGNFTISPDANNIKQRIYVYDDALPATSLKNVVIITNFSVASQNVNPSFPYTGTWYNLMDNTSINVTNVTATIAVPAGGFRVYGNKQALLGTEDFEMNPKISLSPNPSSNYFTINAATTNVQIFSITGQLIKSFKNTFTTTTQFDVSDLNKGVYIVKATDDNNRESSMKLMKQ